MCDHCLTRKSWRTELDEDEVLSWEYIEDLDDDGCPAHAIALITGRYVEDHLCKDCTVKETDQWYEGLADFLREHGFQKSVDYLPITGSPGECTGPSCSNLASFAKMVIETWGYCEIICCLPVMGSRTYRKARLART